MEEFTVILAVIFLIFGVLQIILFFKIWGMCDNISKIKENTTVPKVNNYAKADDYAETAEEQLYLGNKEKAKEYFLLAKYRYENNFDKEAHYECDYADERAKEIDEMLSKL